MDDVFQIIIYLLIIISFIAPIFKKKDQQKKQQQQRFPLQNDFEEPASNNTAVENKQQDYDVLKELENFFKVGNEEETQQENFIETKQEPDPQVRKSDYQSIWDRKKAEVEKVVNVLDKKIENQAKQFEEQLAYQQVRQTNKLVLQLKNNIRNPSTLREYILFSEIIGKPKALRR